MVDEQKLEAGNWIEGSLQGKARSDTFAPAAGLRTCWGLVLSSATATQCSPCAQGNKKPILQ